MSTILVFRWGTVDSKFPKSLAMTEMTKFQDCSDYISSRGYNARPPTQDEMDFPIAYERFKMTKVTFFK